jgi:alkylated DNA repair protein alkB homolog 6
MEDLDFDEQVIDGLPESAYYVPNFISSETEKTILHRLGKIPHLKWTTLSHRRLLSLPGVLAGANRDTLLQASIPKFLGEPVINKLQEETIFHDSPHKAPNHILVNEYRPGEGIMPHEDGPAYHPTTVTVSLGSHTVLDIYKKNEQGERESEPSWRILQEPRSLLITTGGMYSSTLHGISEIEVDKNLTPESIVNWHLLGDTAPFASGSATRTTRVSLTYRDVIKVTKLGNAFKFFSKPSIQAAT